MIVEGIIVLVCVVFSAVYIHQQLGWAREMEQRVKAMEDLLDE